MVRNPLSVRLGLRYVRGLRAEAAARIEAERARRPFRDVVETAVRAELRDDEVQTLAHAGAFAAFGLTRRQALWQASAIPQGPLLRHPAGEERCSRIDSSRAQEVLPEMDDLERSLADYREVGLTVGPHLVAYLRAGLRREGLLCARDLESARNGQWVELAGLVIVRQRPGTAKGMCFLTLEDETGLANAAVQPQVFDRYRGVLHTAPLLRVAGPLQKVDGVTHILVRQLAEVPLPKPGQPV